MVRVRVGLDARVRVSVRRLVLLVGLQARAQPGDDLLRGLVPQVAWLGVGSGAWLGVGLGGARLPDFRLSG